MAEEKNYALPLIAIVAIVGVIMMFMNKGTTTYTTTTATPEVQAATQIQAPTPEQLAMIKKDLGDQNLAGNAASQATCCTYFKRMEQYAGSSLSKAYYTAWQYNCAIDVGNGWLKPLYPWDSC